MGKHHLDQLRQINDIEEFINFIRPYYPGLNIGENLTIENIEKEIFHTFIKLIGKILIYSPEHMRNFLKDYLLNFEIINIKTLILGSIVGLSAKEKSENINLLVEEFLDNVDFIKGLIEISNLDEIIIYMQDTKYYEIIREGIKYYKANSETFVLEAFLDQFYYQNLVDKKRYLDKHEKRMINVYIDGLSEIYDINMIFRGIRNGLDKNLLSQFLVGNHLFFNDSILYSLLSKKNLNDFFAELRFRFSEKRELNTIYDKLGINEAHPIWSLYGIYLNYINSKTKVRAESIEQMTVSKIMDVLINKEKEIIFYILPNVVKILHQKYEDLKK